jgi:hypothetical protein
MRTLWKHGWGKAVILLAAALLYLLSTVPVGLALYAVKMHLGWDVFSRTGFHAFAACLADQVSRMDTASAPASTGK